MLTHPPTHPPTNTYYSVPMPGHWRRVWLNGQLRDDARWPVEVSEEGGQVGVAAGLWQQFQQQLGQATEAAPQVSEVAAPPPPSRQSGASSANQETEVSEVAAGLWQQFWQQFRQQVEEAWQDIPQPLSRESGVSKEGPAWAWEATPQPEQAQPSRSAGRWRQHGNVAAAS